MRQALALALALGMAIWLVPPAGAAPQAASPPWFVPPPPSHVGIERSRMDVHDLAGREEITVIGHRAPTQRDPHGEEVRDFQPMRSDAAGPVQHPSPTGACSPTYETVAGQPASGMDMLSMGPAGCQ